MICFFIYIFLSFSKKIFVTNDSHRNNLRFNSGSKNIFKFMSIQNTNKN